MSGTASRRPGPGDKARWFDEYARRLAHDSVLAGAQDGPYACPCCGYLTLGERGGFEICDVCFWEDDGQDDHDADIVRGGPNGASSLSDARRSFDAVGASDERHIYSVRPPEPDEIPDDGSARPLPEAARGKRRQHRFRDV
ncbi:MAG TPA: CPCC family cysteine-rich protein [Actinophytocola sp.]|nr:CPCC family cysteine-rich protein [Actinophytocola sp.]